jgi:hypothetical protein
MKTTFDFLPFETRFIFRGREYVKVALSLAEDAARTGYGFQYETEVEADPSVVSPGAAVRVAIAGEAETLNSCAPYSSAPLPDL